MASTAVATRPSAQAPAGSPARPQLPAIVPTAQRWGAVTIAATAAAAAQVMVFAGLIAAFFTARTAGGAWPPKELHLDNYRATTLVFTALLVSGMVQWAVHAARHDDHRHGLIGLAMAFGLQAALADLVWYTAQNAGVGAGSSAYATLYYAILGAFLVACVVGLLAVLVAILRAVGGHVTSDNHQAITAAALQVHTLTFLWICIDLAIWVRR
jgi:heme/copper-type cytochrome/quinol oxidase subunit 3